MSAIKNLAKKLIYYTLPASYIVMFHHITDKPQPKKSGCLLSYDKFENFILRYEAYYSSLEDVVKKRKKKKIAITFDDGLADVYTLAYPLLKRHNIPFAVFILTDFLDTPGYISTEQLKEMSADPLVTVGSHGITHEIFPKLDTEHKKSELYDSKKILNKLTGKDIEIFAYSHGQYDKESLDLVKCYDYAMSVKGVPLNLFTRSKYLMPRFNIEEATFDKTKALFDKRILKKSAKRR